MKLLLRTIAVSAAALCTFATSADILNQHPCPDCRSTEFSRDFGNHALNLTYGSNSGIFEGEMIIINPEGGWVYVDLSFVLVENPFPSFSDFFGVDLGIPTGKILIQTTTDTTETDQYEIDLDIIDTMGPLGVGEIDGPPPPADDDGTVPGGGDSSGGGNTGGGGVGSGSGSGSGGVGGPGNGGGNGWACTSAGEGWHCVAY